LALSVIGDFYNWRKRHFVAINEHRWLARDAGTEALIRKQLARYAFAIELNQSGASIPDPLYQRLHFRWDKAHRERLKAYFPMAHSPCPKAHVWRHKAMGQGSPCFAN
jgi:hypothetical protein